MNLRQRPVGKGAQFIQGMSEQCTGRSAYSYVARLDRSK